MLSFISGQSDINNPFASAVMPNYKFWSPWVGKNSRASNFLYNTEYKKCFHQKNIAERGTSLISLDEVMDILDEGSVSCYIYVIIVILFFWCSKK